MVDRWAFPQDVISLLHSDPMHSLSYKPPVSTEYDSTITFYTADLSDVYFKLGRTHFRSPLLTYLRPLPPHMCDSYQAADAVINALQHASSSLPWKRS